MKRIKLSLLTALLIGCISLPVVAVQNNVSGVFAEEHNIVKVPQVNPTCYSDGIKEYYNCIICGEKYLDSDGSQVISDFDAWKNGDGKINKLSHILEVVEGKDSSCTEAGYLQCYRCVTCNQYFEDKDGKTIIGNESAYETWKLGDGSRAKQSHAMTLINGQDATCTAYGYKEAWKCSKCGLYYEDVEGSISIGDLDAYNSWKTSGGKVNPNGHTLNKVAGKIPTCNQDGYKDAWVCYDCMTYFANQEGTVTIGDRLAYEAWKLNEGAIPCYGHNLTRIAGQAPTCTIDGWRDYYICSDCGKLYSDIDGYLQINDFEYWKTSGGKVNARGHTYVYVAEVQATPEQNGVKAHYVCSECDRYFIKDNGRYLEVSYTQLLVEYKEPESTGLSAGMIALIILVPSATIIAVGIIFFVFYRGKKKVKAKKEQKNNNKKDNINEKENE